MVLIKCIFLRLLFCPEILTCPHFGRLTLAEYHEQEEIFKLRLGHLKKVRREEKKQQSMNGYEHIVTVRHFCQMKWCKCTLKQ